MYFVFQPTRCMYKRTTEVGTSRRVIYYYYLLYLLTVFKALRSAPLAISISAITTLFDKQAMCRGVFPFCQCSERSLF
jgi:hypothetical protein